MSESTNNIPIDNVQGTPPPEDTSDEETIYPQQPDMTCTTDPTQTSDHRQVVGVENAEGKAYGKATGLYNKHHKPSVQWNPWHPLLSAHNFQQAQPLSQQTKTWIDQHLRRGKENFKMISFQCAHALQTLLSEIGFGFGHFSWIEDC
jgi:hypothetical protein